MPQVIAEITRDYDIDAIFANHWQGHGVCHCQSCKARFHTAAAMDLPQTGSAADPAYGAWRAWRRDVLSALVLAWDAQVRAIRPHARFIPNMSGHP